MVQLNQRPRGSGCGRDDIDDGAVNTNVMARGRYAQKADGRLKSAW